VKPDIWTKLTAFGTVGAVGAAVLLAIWGGHAGRRALIQQDDREARAEARKVVLLPGHDEELWPSDDGDSQELRITEYLDVVNAGDEPILEARMIWGGSDRTNDSMADWQWLHGTPSYHPLVLANDRVRFHGQWQIKAPGESQQLSNADRGGLFGVVMWSDARDRHWIRRGRDQPVELKEPIRYGSDLKQKYRHDKKNRVIKDSRALWAKNKSDQGATRSKHEGSTKHSTA
jgi:hypothetical protein